MRSACSPAASEPPRRSCSRCTCRTPPTARCRRRWPRCARAERPLMVIGSQAVVQAAEAHALAAAVQRLGIPVYLSGMARGLLGRDHPLQMRHQRRIALREADCVLLAGVPCDFRLDYGKHVRRSATLIAANRSAKDARLNRRPERAGAGRCRRSSSAALADALGTPGAAWAGWCDSAARARCRTRGRDRRAGRSARRTRQPAGLLPRAGGRSRRQRHLRGRRRRLRGHRQLRAAPARAAELAGPGRLRHAGRGRGLCHRRGAGTAGQRGVDRLGRRRLRLGPGRVRHHGAPAHPGHRRGGQRRRLDADCARAGEDAARRRGHRAGAQRLPPRGRPASAPKGCW